MCVCVCVLRCVAVCCIVLQCDTVRQRRKMCLKALLKLVGTCVFVCVHSCVCVCVCVHARLCVRMCVRMYVSTCQQVSLSICPRVSSLCSYILAYNVSRVYMCIWEQRDNTLCVWEHIYHMSIWEHIYYITCTTGCKQMLHMDWLRLVGPIKL